MKRKPLQQLSLTSVLRELAILPSDAFSIILKEVQGAQAFDTDRRRLEILTKTTKIEEETLSLLLSALNYLYSEIHSGAITVDITPEIIDELLSTLEKSDISYTSEAFSENDKTTLKDRLPKLLEKKQSTDRFRKSERLKAGFLPAAISFTSFVDLRPLLSEDQTQIEELIPLVQFRIRTDSNRQDLKNFVFQMDASSLSMLKEAVEKAEQKLSSISDSDWVKHLIVKNTK